MGPPSAAVVDMWQLLTIQIFLVTAADARNCFAWAVGLTLWLRDRCFFPNLDAAIYASLYGHFVREMHKTIPPSFLEDRRKQGFESAHGLSQIAPSAWPKLVLNLPLKASKLDCDLNYSWV